MRDSFTPRIDLKTDIQGPKLSTFNEPFRMNEVKNDSKIPEFKDVMAGMVKELNNTTKAPDQVMQSAMTGNGADIHDAIIAISKAEIGINIATNITTKVVQAYEKVISIQV